MAKKKLPVSASESPSSFGSLGDLLRRSLPQENLSTPQPLPPASLKPSTNPTPQEKNAAPSFSQATLALALRGTLSLRHERKGHGGKTVTKITGLQGDSAALDEIATQMKKSLGCGARIEGNEIILQGEMLERARLWLEEHGARRITLATRPSSPTPPPHKKA